MGKGTKNLRLFLFSLMIPAFGLIFFSPVYGNVVPPESLSAKPVIPLNTTGIAPVENTAVCTMTPEPTPIKTITPNPTIGSKPTSHLIAGNIKVQTYNFIRSVFAIMITPRFRLYNTGSSPIELSTVKIRYYYTVDGIKPQKFLCLISSVRLDHITGTFVKMPTTRAGANYYLEIGFTKNAGSLAAGTGIDIHTHFAKTGNTEYRQNNDYSFNPAASGYVDWPKATGYISGILKWGKEP